MNHLVNHKERHDEKGTGFGVELKDENSIATTLRANGALCPTDNHIKIKSATLKGYEEATEGDSINFSVPNSETRRGRVGKQVAQTFKEKLESKQNIYGQSGRSKAIEIALRESFAADKKEPEAVAWSVGEVVDQIGSSTPNPPPECEHGHILKQGISKGGKPYYGYVCKGNVKEHAVWAKLSPNGRWFFDGEIHG